MTNIDREEIHILSRHTNLDKNELYRLLKTNVYSDKTAWQKFLRVFLLSLGIGFVVAGIVFFFAYNWADLHKFVKIGLIEALVIASTGVALIPTINQKVRNLVLTGAAVLVGVLFSVYGQVYQTGANAYDFFLAWTFFITLWVIVSNFAPLWLLFILLVNTTLILYSQQVAKDWSGVFVFTLLFIINVTSLLCFMLVSFYKTGWAMPGWLLKALALSAATYATIGLTIGIFEKYETAFFILIIISLVAFIIGYWHGLRKKSGFYLALIPFCGIIILSALLLKISDGAGMFLLVGLFVVASITLVIKNLLIMQKKWANEN